MSSTNNDNNKPKSFHEIYTEYIESNDYPYIEKLPSHETMNLRLDFEQAMDRIMSSCGLEIELNESGCKVYPSKIGEHRVNPKSILSSCFDNIFGGQLDAKGGEDEEESWGEGDEHDDGSDDDDVD